MHDIDLAAARAFAEELAREAGEIAQAGFGLGTEKQWKEDTTPLTVTDSAINALALRQLRAAYPDASIIAEEGSDERPGADWTWVCDPIDGTIPFSLGIPAFTVLLALLHEGRPVVGVVYDPVLERMFSAVAGGGATMNGTPLHVSTAGFEHGMVGVPISAHRGMYLPLVTALMERGVRSLGLYSAGYTSALVAAGECLAYLYSYGSVWDVAAPALLIEEAGGRVTDLHGAPLRFDGPFHGMLATNGVVHDEMLAMLDATVPDR